METLYVIRDNESGKFVCLIPSDEFDYFWENAEYASKFRTRDEAYRNCEKVKELCNLLRKPVPSMSVDAI